MKKFEIVRKGNIRWYYSPLFNVCLMKTTQQPLVVFSNGEEAVAVFVTRQELSSILRNKFKNHTTRRRERAKKTLKKLA
jgi:hypothetical protein